MNDINNNEKVRDILEQESVPEEISPENMKIMLDEKTSAKKRKKISMAGKITAMAASLALIVGTAVGTAGIVRNFGNSNHSSEKNVGIVTDNYKPKKNSAEKSETVSTGNSYMAGAESYGQIYNLLKTESEKRSNSRYVDSGTFGAENGIAADNFEEEAVDESSVAVDIDDDIYFDGEKSEAAPEESFDSANGAEESEFSKTYDQEEGVLEADIVKTDGKRIFYLSNSETHDDVGYHESCDLNIAAVDDGNFTNTMTVNVAPEVNNEGDGWETNVFVNDMYLYNDMIAVIGNVNSYRDSCTIDSAKGIDNEYMIDDYYYENNNSCFVSFYTNEDSPQLIGTYWQDGGYNDVRISPEGYMFLVSTYYSCDWDNIEGEDDIEAYIPKCGVDEGVSCLPASDILLPGGSIDNPDVLSYTVIGSIDLNTAGQFSPVDSKALAGYTGNLYSSAENIYTTVGWEDTEITRISTVGGIISPAASGKVEGCLKDQFSMSEYNGYFRIATTIEKWEVINNEIGDGVFTEQVPDVYRDNCVYVLDMELNQVGKVDGFGIDETIKSVNFSGDMGYVVTYEQTDPLFAIDLSNPTEPFITDEFKILGYSTYMQKWSDGLLLGFGVDADEEGIENGVKLTMFDNSDPYDLKEVGTYAVNSLNREEYYIYSNATWERKALLIAPEKNLIGVPICQESWFDDGYDCTSKYMFFSYENGEFIPLGEISNGMSDYNEYESFVFDRAVYIDDYVYAICDGKMVSADAATITVKDIAEF